jgi:N-6 DNA Methylase
MKSYAAELLAYGIPSEAILDFEAPPTARDVRYLDLFRSSDDIVEDVLPSGVIESATRPAIYFKSSGGLGSAALSQTELQELIRALACRADARYLALLSPGVVTVYKIGFFDVRQENNSIFKVAPGDFRLRNLISGLDLPSLTSVGNSDAQWLEGHLFQLLKGSAKEIRDVVSVQSLSNGDVISLIGRALFTRFLADREILKNSELRNVSRGATDAYQLLDTPTAASATFRWLDSTFNGDLLHLSNSDYSNFFMNLGEKATSVCHTLGNIMRRAPGGQLSLDWGGLRFKHIPVDVLSQVYEHFAHENFPELAKKTSVHYTPRGIAELVVDGTFMALPADTRADAKVLDAAAGAGVFLVLAFRRLVGELWIRQNRRPNRKQIRRVLNTQLCGMDINPESLKMAALSLYLAALELDPDPQPLSDLKFAELFNTVLHCVSAERLEGPDAHLGSLANGTPDIGQFDIVLGNPPWTELSIKDKPFLESLAKEVIKSRLPDDVTQKVNSSLVPRQAPDLAFLWKSMNWCKSNGAIGYVLHARLLFNADHYEARKLLFSYLRVTGLINASALRQLPKVWPSNSAPFCALVAMNSKPLQGDSFYYLNPQSELTTKVTGEIRLDPSAATPVPNELVKDCTFALKALFKGSALDLNLIQRISQSPQISFDQCIQNDLSSDIHQGYMMAARDKSASHIADLPSLETDNQPRFEVHASHLKTVHARYPKLLMQWPRPSDIYKGPLILFREAPKAEREMRGALWCADNVAFSRSYYGLNIERNSNIGEYFFVLSYSDLFAYWAIHTSAKFGIERPTFNLEDIRNFPVAPYDTLSGVLRETCQTLANQIRAGACPWGELEQFVKTVYRLSDLDWQLITDTLTYASPHSKSLKCAITPTHKHSSEVAGFMQEIKASLDDLLDDSFAINVMTVSSLNDWLFVEILKNVSTDNDSNNAQSDAALLANQIANEKSFWTTQLRVQIGPDHWLIGQPTHARYWTKSKARLLALQLSEAGLFATNMEHE